MSVGTMAKKKTRQPSEPKRIVFAMRGSDEYRSWMDRLAEFAGLSVSAIVVNALRLYAKSIGFPEAPPKR